MGTDRPGLTRRRAVAAGASATAGGVLAAACATGGAGGNAGTAPGTEPVTLLMANWGAIPQGWQDLGAAFTAEAPTIKVEFSPVEGGSWGNYFEKVAVMAASGSPPDVARVALEGVQLVAHKGMALPLDPYIKRDQGQLKDYFPDVNQNMLKSMSYNGKQYQLPFTWNGP